MNSDVMWERYDQADWWIDRMGNMEFLSDQMFNVGDQLGEQFNMARAGDLLQYGFQGYSI